MQILVLVLCTLVALPALASDTSHDSNPIHKGFVMPPKKGKQLQEVIRVQLSDGMQTSGHLAWFPRQRIPLAQPFPKLITEDTKGSAPEGFKRDYVSLNQLNDILESLLTKGTLSEKYNVEFQRYALNAMINWGNFFSSYIIWRDNDRPDSDRFKSLLQKHTKYSEIAESFGNQFKAARFTVDRDHRLTTIDREGRTVLSKIMIQMALYDAIRSKVQDTSQFGTRLTQEASQGVVGLNHRSHQLSAIRERIVRQADTTKVTIEMGNTLADWLTWRYAWMKADVWKNSNKYNKVDDLVRAQKLTEVLTKFEARFQLHIPDTYKEITERVLQKITTNAPMPMNPFLVESTWNGTSTMASDRIGAVGALVAVPTALTLVLGSKIWVGPYLQSLLSQTSYDLLASAFQSTPILLTSIVAAIYVGYRAARSVTQLVGTKEAIRQMKETLKSRKPHQTALIDASKGDWNAESIVVRLQNRCLGAVSRK